MPDLGLFPDGELAFARERRDGAAPVAYGVAMHTDFGGGIGKRTAFGQECQDVVLLGGERRVGRVTLWFGSHRERSFCLQGSRGVGRSGPITGSLARSGGRKYSWRARDRAEGNVNGHVFLRKGKYIAWQRWAVALGGLFSGNAVLRAQVLNCRRTVRKPVRPLSNNTSS